MKLLNVGCGRHFHPAWHNIDLVSCDPQVQAIDLRKGIPFDADQFDAVYHSHVLEHLTAPQGRSLVEDCLRVLRPGGVLRIAVPDLEMIARQYLETLDQAEANVPQADADYEWMKLELIDQMTRTTSGGEMGARMSDPHLANRAFVESRVGSEFWQCADANRRGSVRATASRQKNRLSWSYLKQKLGKIRQKVAVRIVGALIPGATQAMLREAIFRQSGEIHRWMYDRYSLGQLMKQAGLINVQVCQADQSAIERFSEYELDTVDGRVRKPDSLFMEGVKPAAAAAKAA